MSEKLPKKIAIFSFAVLLIALLSFLEFQLLGFINQKFGELYSYIVGLNIPFILGFLVYFINKKYYNSICLHIYWLYIA